MTSYMDCWAGVAADLFAQALAGEPQLAEGSPRPLPAGGFGFAARLSGDEEGRFSVVLENSILETPLLGDGVDQKAGWSELLREIAAAAASELLAKAGKKCRLDRFEAIDGEGQVSRAFELRSGERVWTLLVRDELRAAPAKEAVLSPVSTTGSVALRPGFELLLDVELEASLRFGSREMPLGEILDLGPGDVVQLDRHVSDPVDLLVGDKIVARGEVVLINGNFGLRVTEVAEPQKRLESIRCLF
ncbi:MAG TPA: FliM/FliN family flagellar motor switch protein [Terracidiphilus sp.]|nr:FliM/FliN family flagellar motor switch protein [Terracidiphilus sp.]